MRGGSAIVLIASGAMPEEVNVPDEQHAEWQSSGPYGPSGLDRRLPQACWGNFDGITEHWYARADTHLISRRPRSMPAGEPSNARLPVRRRFSNTPAVPPTSCGSKAEEWQVYQQRFPP